MSEKKKAIFDEQEKIKLVVIAATKERLSDIRGQIIAVQETLNALKDRHTSEQNFLIDIYERGVDAIKDAP